MKHIITTLLILICVTSLIGCKDSSEPSKQMPDTEPNMSDSNVSDPNESPSTESPTMPPSDTFEIVGTVTYKNIEGGFYAIDTEDGSKYDPINLPESFRKDGLKVKVIARLKTDAMSFHMYGSIIDILNIAAQ
ncbi:MAG: hypothetical protein ACTSR4_09920 [Candidatus Hodarchaeales archaeon]